MKKKCLIQILHGKDLSKFLLTMKLIILLSCFTVLQMNASVFSQSGEISVNLNNSTIKDVFDVIENKFGYKFIYSDDLVNANKKISVDIEKKNIEEAIHLVLNESTYSYKVLEDRLIVIYPSKLEEQGIVIKGKITDAEGNSLPGVNIVEKGTTSGAVSDLDGNYSISVSSPDAVLVFSYIGYLSEEIEIAGQTAIDLTLIEDIQALEEVVVVGYGTAKKEDLTGSVKRANIESFRESPNINIAQSLQGTVPGLNIGQTDVAGEEASLSVRGSTTINGNKSVLVVVDGIIFNGSLSDLNPNDIESIDILKDPSSMAIYGAQAANGVLLVSTKTGKKSDKPVFSYTGSYTTQNPSNELSLFNAEEFIQKSYDVDWESSYQSPNYTELKPGWSYADIVTDPPLREGYENGTDYDWWDNATDPGFITDHNLSVRGSTDKVSYYIAGGYMKQKGFVLNDKYERITSRINFENSILPWFKIGAQTFGSFADYSGSSPTISTLSRMAPFVTPKDDEGNYILNPNGADVSNPFLVASADDFDKRNTLFGNFYADITLPFIEGLNYRLNFGNNYSWDRHYNSNEYSAGNSGEAYKEIDNWYDWTLDNILSYKKTLIDIHRFNLTLVVGRRERNHDYTEALGSNYNDLTLGYNNISLASVQEINSSAWDESYLYQMARLNYGFKRKYLITATIRRDGFSGFAKNEKFALFPSIGLGWVASEENFIDISWLDYLKFRGSYGTNGNLVDHYSSLAKIESNPAYVFGDGGSTLFGKEVTSLANPNLAWEKTVGYNFGMEFIMLDSRLRGNIDYYLSTTKDLIFDVSIPEITGFSDIRTNVGEVANRGIEFELNSYIIRSGDFSWNLNFNISSNKNEIISLIGLDEDGDGVEDDMVASGLFIGESINAIYGYESAGIIQLGEDIPEGFFVGTHRIVDNNDDGKIDPDDRIILGREEPAYSFGILNEFNYKNFTFKFFINSIQGGKDGYLGKNMLEGFGIGDNIRRNNFWKEYDYWTPSNSGAEYRRLDQAPAYDYVHYNDRSFVRLQDVTLSYRLAPNSLANFGIQGLKLYVSGKNLLTITDWKGWDPETGVGFASTGRPVMRGISVGVDLNF